MSGKDLFTNPLDDYVLAPSALDRASAAIADQARQYHQSLVDSLKSDEIIDKIEATIELTEIPAAKHLPIPHANKSMFYGECPEFGVSDVGQSLLQHQWEYCKTSTWFDTDGGGIVRDTMPADEISFLTAVAVVKNLSIEQFVGIQPIETEYAKMMFLQPLDLSHHFNAITPTPSFNLLTMVVEATQRRLRTKLTHETMQDFRAAYGVEAAHEIAKLFADAITAELYHDIRTKLFTSAHNLSFIHQSNEETSLELYREAIDISTRNTRGKANKLIASNAIVAALVKTEEFEVIDNVNKRYKHVTYVGQLGKTNLEVYCDHTLPHSQSLMLYKGVSESDAPYFVCPYRLIAMGGVTVDPSTFEPSRAMYTIYGETSIQKTDENDNFVTALQDYVTHIVVSDLEYTVEDDRILTELFDEKPISSAPLQQSRLSHTEEK